MTSARLHRPALGAGLVVLGAASAVAVAVDAGGSPATVLLAATLGLAAGLLAARGRTVGVPAPVRPSVGLTLAALAVAAVVWLVVGAVTAGALDDAGLPARSELFAFTDGLVAAVGVVLLRSP